VSGPTHQIVAVESVHLPDRHGPPSSLNQAQAVVPLIATRDSFTMKIINFTSVLSTASTAAIHRTKMQHGAPVNGVMMLKVLAHQEKRVCLAANRMN
jgi:hypothetical protein